VILADEPVSALDPAAADRVLRLLYDLARQDGLAVVAVLHQPELARLYADRVVGVLDGVIVFDAPPQAVEQEAVAALYAVSGEST
jgi:phosphonate transport system ATP-binding protein